MTELRRRRALSVLAFAMAISAPAQAAEIVLFSSNFSSDDTTYFELWEEFSYPDPVLLGWDQSLGSPAPGSLRIEVAGDGQGFALGQCSPVDHTASYTIRGDVLALTDGANRPGCFLNFFFYPSDDCTGDQADGPSDGVDAGFEWLPVSHSILAAELPSIYRSFRASILATTDQGGGSCNVDNLRISQATPAEVPAVGPIGTAGAVSLVAVLGIIVLARLRR